MEIVGITDSVEIKIKFCLSPYRRGWLAATERVLRRVLRHDSADRSLYVTGTR